MTIKKIIRNGNGFNFTVFSPNTRDNKAYYHLNFDPVCNHFGIKFGDFATISHYNKFERKWGLIDCTNANYEIVDNSILEVSQIPLNLLLPDDVEPDVLIRGILLYEGVKGDEFNVIAYDEMPTLDLPPDVPDSSSRDVDSTLS